MLERATGDVAGPGQVDLQDPVEHLGRDLLEATVRSDAGGVDDAVHGPELGEGFGERGGHGVAVGHVGREHHDARTAEASALARDQLEVGTPPGEQRERAPVLGETEGIPLEAPVTRTALTG